MFIECKKELTRLINDEYKRRNPEVKEPPKFALPASFDYCKNNETLYLTIKKVTSNMQDNSSAFDSWALVIKNWVLEIKKIILKWESPEDISDLHYQRFLYGVQKATSVYSNWLEIEVACKPLLDDLLIKSGNKYVVNIPREEAKENAKYPEAKIERLFVNCHNDILANAVKMDNISLYSQLPVGLFKNNIANENRIFPSNNAMIDIWGLSSNKNELHIFELKEPNNYTMGIYSELFFYAMFEKDIIDKNFIYEGNIKCFRGICELRKLDHKLIKAHFLAAILHPLIDKKMINIINGALKAYDIEFDYIKYHIDVNCQIGF